LSPQPLLSVNALSCERGGRRLFSPLTLSVLPGDYVELIGANGSGKSTLLRTLAGLHSQFTGEYLSQDVLYQGHRLGLDGLLTPLENLAWFAGLEDQTLDHEATLNALQRAGVLTKAYSLCSAMSAGQQRRVAMARWLLSVRKLWLLDEPLTALDASAQDLLRDVIAEHCANGGAVICATHNAIAIDGKSELVLDASIADTLS
jgi:heme exporter protein A